MTATDTTTALSAPETKTLETKIAGMDAPAAFDATHRAFAAYQESNDERVAALERRGAADPLTDERTARIERTVEATARRMDHLALKAARPGLEGAFDPALAERKSAFARYARTGEAAPLRALEEKALSAGSGPDGGFLVTQQAERELLRRLALLSPIRAMATVREVSTGTFRKAFSATGPAAGWVGEVAARPETASPALIDVSFPAMELYAMPSATQTMLDDAAVDVEAWLTSEVETAFAEREGAAFVNGDGVNKPRGFLNYTKVANGSWAPDKVGYLATGVSGAFPAANPSDLLVDLVYALRGAYRQNAAFVMSRTTQAAVRKFKDSTGGYLWAPPASLGAPATLMTYPVVEAEDMPGIATDSFAIAFGDFRRAYLVVDRQGVRVLRDPFTAKPYVLFYVTKRVGGGLQDLEAVKLLKFGVS